ncbi:FAD/NAD(P)-dependent oxidoreductase [Spelaeicoccus albus]|uniref:Thioredoxin reductase n=1 Tax=Spelaeicoccus albus TaxID=1280376 RepID=A0A7Z0D2I6_9MICO|nr:NAD(P)/FAD-dependent oxidoreductase [Spelaeicoccus albus]NYI67675.1 thioredoxin reductase [Spelaeicoccus albus]
MTSYDPTGYDPAGNDPAGYDLAVIGGGPAGMAAAATATRGGLRVALIDAGPGLGGQFWRQPAPNEDATAFGEADAAGYHHDLATFRRLRGEIFRARADARLELFSGHHVWTAACGPGGVRIRAVDKLSEPGRDIERIVSADAVVLAPGAYDRQVPFPGWDLPGVMTAGGLQALLKAGGVAAGPRVAVGGTGPFLLPVAAGLAMAGSHVVGVFEASATTAWTRHAGAALANPGNLAEGAGYAAALARYRVPYRQRSMIVAAHGTEHVESVSVAGLRPDGHVDTASVRTIDVDAVGVGWGFTPSLELPMTLGCEVSDGDDGSLAVVVDADQRSSVAGVYVAGEACGIGGAALAVAEGETAGRTACRDAGLEADPSPAAARTIRRRRRFARAMAVAHPVPPAWQDVLEPSTIVCRCEEVDAEAVDDACRNHGATDARGVKELNRAGMGWCQGRTCGYAVDCLAARAAGIPMTPQPAPRPVAAPLTLGALAADDAGPDH